METFYGFCLDFSGWLCGFSVVFFAFNCFWRMLQRCFACEAPESFTGLRPSIGMRASRSHWTNIFACVTDKRCLATHFWREATQVIILIARTDLFHRYINNSCFSWNTIACGKHFNHLGLSWTLIRVLIWRFCSQPHSVCEQPDRGAVAGLDRWLSVNTFALTELKRWSSSGLTARMFEE